MLGGKRVEKLYILEPNISNQEDTKKPFRWKRWVAIGTAIAITAVIIIFRQEIARFSTYGYIGLFLVALLGNATVIFPVPGLVGVFAAGSVLNPWLVGLTAGVAEPLGELTGYLAGYGGQPVIEDRDAYQRIARWMQGRNYFAGYVTIFILSLIPNPFFDLAGIAAGAMRLPVLGFLASCWLGKTIKALIIAFAGAYSVNWIERFLW
jgi:membrane protein YqaA with SNARE-associated domain